MSYMYCSWKTNTGAREWKNVRVEDIPQKTSAYKPRLNDFPIQRKEQKDKEILWDYLSVTTLALGDFGLQNTPTPQKMKGKA